MNVRIDGSGMGGVLGRIVLLLGVVWAGFAQASGPVELPPQDYLADQYIDSAGCVYRRQGPVWAPRLDGEGAVICGYPPSLPGYVGPEVGDKDDLALRLAVTLADGLQDGDMLADPPDTLKREEVATPKPKSGPLADLDQAAAAMPALREAAVGLGGNDRRLCDLLGYGAGTAMPGGEAGNATLGYCSGPVTVLQPKVVAGEAVAKGGDSGAAHGDATPAPAAPQTGAAATRTAAAQARTDRPASAEPTTRNGKPAAKAAQTGTAPVTASGRGVDPALVPANARFVQIGRYAEAAQAEAAIQRLSGLGYPVVRGVKMDEAAGGRVIMAGPFADRRSVIAALNHLRAQGYAKAFAR